MSLTLYAPPTNKNGLKALIAAEYVGVEVKVAENFEMRVTNRTPEFLKMNPFGKIPVLQTPDGPIFESNAVARYIANLDEEHALLGSSNYETSVIDQWIDAAATEFDSALSRWLYPLLGYRPYIAQEEKPSLEALKTVLDVFNKYFASNTYVVGHCVTLADIILACNLLMAFKTGFTKEFISQYPHLERYFWTIANQPKVKKHFGEVTLPQKVPTPPKKDAKKGAEEKKPKEKETPKPKEPEPKPEAPLGEEEEKPKPKPKNPLDLLPPSPMIMDDWKRLYSNTKAKDFREVAIAGFWNMYDPEGYSLWFCDYKYNEENTVTFVTMNKVSGFLQRMDFIRKHGFAKMCIFGESAPYKIKGVWLFRGQTIPQIVLDECYDAELYEWTKVDINDEAQKERVNAYFEEPDEYDGDKLLEAKCFK